MFHCNLLSTANQSAIQEAGMDTASDQFVLRGAHVIDPGQGIDRIANVHVAGEKIDFVGSKDVAPGTKVVDVSGCYLSPGWVDIHVHAYGTLGFANPDTVGVYHGVTSFVDAGGPGIGVLDQFMELLDGLKTSLYAGLSATCRLPAGSTLPSKIATCCVT
jgi:dihydroorotase